MQTDNAAENVQAAEEQTCSLRKKRKKARKRSL